MKKVITLIICLTVFANHAYPEPRETSGAFLKIGQGARALSMGEAFAGLADDLSCLYWNPAGLTQIKRRKDILFSYNGLTNDIHQVFAGYGPHYLWHGSLGFSLNYLTVGEIEERSGLSLEPEGELSGSDVAIGLTYSRRLRPGLSLGMSTKYIRERLADESGNSLALDLGVLYKRKDLRFGGCIQNIGPKLEGGDLPMNLKVGLGKTLKERLNLALDLDITHPARIHLGGEYRLRDILTLRAGYQINQGRKELNFPTGFSMGVGLITNNLQFDYAFLPYGDLGNTHRLSISKGWPMPNTPPGVIDLKILPSAVLPGEPVTITSNGEDREDMEPELRCEVQYRTSLAGWTSIPISYLPVEKCFKAELIPKESEQYSLRVRYIDTEGDSSRWKEYKDGLMVKKGFEVKIVKNLDKIPTAIYHLFDQLDLAPVVYKVTNSTPDPYQVTLTTIIPDLTRDDPDLCKKIVLVKPGETETVFPHIPAYDKDKIARLDRPMVNVGLLARVEWKEKGEIRHKEEAFKVDLLANDVILWKITREHDKKVIDLLPTIVAWVDPEEEIIKEIINKAVQLYAPSSAKEWTEALYDTLKGVYHLSYLDTSIGYPKEAQEIRLMKEYLERGEANCIDGTVLFASLLYKVGIDPIIVIDIKEEHAFVGWRFQKDQAKYYKALETTEIATGSFRQALENGWERIQMLGLKDEFESGRGIGFKDGVFKKGEAIVIDVKYLREEKGMISIPTM